MLPSSTSVTGQTGLSIGVSRLKWKGRRLPCVAWELCDDGPLSDPTMRDVGAMPDAIRKHGGRSGGIVRIRTNIADCPPFFVDNRPIPGL